MYKLKSTLIAFLSITIIVVSCKKTTSNTTIVEEATQARVQSDDGAMVEGEVESADDDVNNTIASSERFCGVGNTFNSSFMLQDATINQDPLAKKITITYNGNVAPNSCKKRTGTITIELVNGARWIDVQSRLKYTFTNFKVENICTNRSIMLNGERFVTNVSGGNMFKLHNGQSDSLVHKIRTGDIGYEATFTDSTGSKTAVWNVAKRVTIKMENQNYFFKIAGDTTFNNIAYTASWGTTRFGNPYQTVYNSPIKANTFCKLWHPTAGEILHIISNTTVTVKYGLNYLGNTVGINECGGFFKVTWVLANGLSDSKVFAYRF